MKGPHLPASCLLAKERLAPTDASIELAPFVDWLPILFESSRLIISSLSIRTWSHGDYILIAEPISLRRPDRTLLVDPGKQCEFVFVRLLEQIHLFGQLLELSVDLFLP